VEVLERTLGQEGALVSAPRRDRSSSTDVLLSFAAAVRLQSVIEKPGPFNEVSKGPEYIFVGLMSHFVSKIVNRLSQVNFGMALYQAEPKSPG